MTFIFFVVEHQRLSIWLDNSIRPGAISYLDNPQLTRIDLFSLNNDKSTRG